MVRFGSGVGGPSSTARNWNSAMAFGIGNGGLTRPGASDSSTCARPGCRFCTSTQSSRPPRARDGDTENARAARLKASMLVYWLISAARRVDAACAAGVLAGRMISENRIRTPVARGAVADSARSMSASLTCTCGANRWRTTSRHSRPTDDEIAERLLGDAAALPAP